ncbi:MAG: DegV family protein, partial [bacterium]
TYRYCTEVLMKSEITSEKIKNLLRGKGDSLITASSGKITRIHLHTDSPAEIVHLLHKRGEIIEQKVDDMKRQQQMSHQNKKNIALVTDSIADIPQDLLDRYQIHLIPVNIIIDGVNYLDKLSISPDYLYKYIKTAEEFPSSSQPGLDFVYKKLREITGYYDSILIISVSEALSGTGKVFQQAKAKLEQDKNIKISYINSRLNSGAQGLLVLKAAEEIEKGKSLNQIEKTIKEYRQNSEILVKVETLEYMVRGGRISPMKGFIANLLHLKPVVSLNDRGEGIIRAKALTKKSVNRKLKNILINITNISNIEKYAVVHARAPEAAVKFKEEIKQILDTEPEYITEISSVTALNSGKGAVALSILAG